MVHAFNITASFVVEGRGRVLVAFFVPECTSVVKSDRMIELRSPSGQSLQTLLRSVESIRTIRAATDGNFPLGLLVAQDVPEEFCQPGTQVWLVEQA